VSAPIQAAAPRRVTGPVSALRGSLAALLLALAAASLAVASLAPSAPAAEPPTTPAPATPAAAPDERALDERVQAITDMLRCPTCQGISVKDSEASFSRQIRDKVRRMVEEGQSDEDIKAYFVSRYGEWILRAPKKEGLGLVLWLAPGTALLLAGGLIGWRLYRSHRHPARDLPPAGANALTPEQQARIQRDLQRFEDTEE
jgi:cytochrome c-type biogenesis protein CcmH